MELFPFLHRFIITGSDQEGVCLMILSLADREVYEDFQGILKTMVRDGAYHEWTYPSNGHRSATEHDIKIKFSETDETVVYVPEGVQKDRLENILSEQGFEKIKTQSEGRMSRVFPGKKISSCQTWNNRKGTAIWCA